jgi:hypothetical protein
MPFTKVIYLSGMSKVTIGRITLSFLIEVLHDHVTAATLDDMNNEIFLHENEFNSQGRIQGGGGLWGVHPLRNDFVPHLLKTFQQKVPYVPLHPLLNTILNPPLNS